ncbi:MAG: hypothetical protein CMJ94_09715 [Planctomycetes bacterium]|nr:hypothetical protein [Planctomycetota bacterium]
MIPLLSVLLALPLAAPQGRVVKVDGTAVSGNITAAQLDGIVVSGASEDQTIEPADVLSVSLGSGGMLAEAQSFLDKLEFQNAVALLEEAANASDPAWMPVVAKLRHAEALLAWSAFDAGRAGDAVAAFQDWLATYPDHFWVARARIGMARAMGRAGQIDEAASELQEVASFAFEKNLGKQVELAARMARCQVYLEGDRAKLARQRLEGSSGLVATLKAAAQDSASPAGLRNQMLDHWTQSVILLGDAVATDEGTGEAKNFWERTLRNERGIGVDARAAGKIAIAQAAREAGQLREAQFALAEVAATMNAGPDTMARALYTLGEICEELDNTPTSGATYFRRVADRFPASTWATKARKKLGQ